MTQLGLGIDTGGTYTDSVLYDFDSQKVIARAKALTTRHNLAEGIIESLGRLPKEQLPEVMLVSLSTTLATNACVEGKGSRGKLVLFGYDADILKKLGNKYGLPPSDEMLVIPGSHGQQGQVVEEPDWDLLKREIDRLDAETDAYGIAEYWGIRNPTFEQKAKRLIREWTGKPVVSAHELSSEINSLRRASTTLLNARLITLIDRLLKAVKEGMKEMGISAPLMVVKGDGTLMSEVFAVERPVETLLSGPAASVVGGMKLNNCRDAIILDIGGTTSDLAVVRDGLAVLAEEGVNIAGWKTGTRAISVNTIGLGGDSQISFDKNEELTIGPRKAAPISWMAAKWPEIKPRLESIRLAERWHTLSLAEFFYIITEPERNFSLSRDEELILKALSKGPKCLEDLAEAVGSRPYFLNTDRLESQGIVGRGALTPTDLMHLTGSYQSWDTEAARLAAEILAIRLGMPLEDLIQAVFRGIERRLFVMIADYLLERSLPKRNYGSKPDYSPLIKMGFDHPFDEIKCLFRTSMPFIGIGAPTHLFLHNVAEAFGTEALISDDAGVANAVGAITGSIIGQETVLIRPRYDISGITGYGCHASSSYFETEDYETAVEWAKETARNEAIVLAEAMGATGIDVTIEVSENKAEAKESGEGLLLETVIIARACGNQAIFALNEC